VIEERQVAIAEGARTDAGELGIAERMALADAGFRETGTIEYALRDEDTPGFRRLVYRVNAESEAEALHFTRTIIGDTFNIRVTTVGEQ
jgi:hypothetical protein